MKNNTTKTVFATRIAKSIAAGQADCVIPLGTAELRTRYNRKFLKYIKVDELFDLCGGSVNLRSSSGTGIAYTRQPSGRHNASRRWRYR